MLFLPMTNILILSLTYIYIKNYVTLFSLIYFYIYSTTRILTMLWNRKKIIYLKNKTKQTHKFINQTWVKITSNVLTKR